MFDTPEIRAEDQRTAEAFAAPQPGDSFQEMAAFHMFVIAVEPHGRVAVMTANPPCTLPQEGKVVHYPDHDAYRAAYSYRAIPGYWIRLARRDVNVEGWFQGWPQPVFDDCQVCAGLIARAGAR